MSICLTEVWSLQIIVDDYMKSETVLKASRMHDELDLDGELFKNCCSCTAMYLPLQTIAFPCCSDHSSQASKVSGLTASQASHCPFAAHALTHQCD